MSPFLAILSRWLHVTTAAVLVGGVFYARIVLPIALRGVGEDAAVRTVLLRGRRVFKMAVHTCVLFTLVSGTYNYVLNRHDYNAIGPVAHGLIGTHLLVGLIVLGVLLWVLAPREPRASGLKWMAVSLGLMLASIAVASTLKYAREHRAVPAAGPAVSSSVPSP